MARTTLLALALVSAFVAVVLIGIGLWTGFDQVGHGDHGGGVSGYSLAGFLALVVAGALAFAGMRMKPQK